MALILACAGCATDTADIRFKAYKDGSIDPSQIATITATTIPNGDILYFEDVDDQSTPYPASNLFKAFAGIRHHAGIIEMSPGKHTFTIGCRTHESGKSAHYSTVEMSLVATAGQQYFVNSDRMRIWITDESGKEVGKNITEIDQ